MDHPQLASVHAKVDRAEFHLNEINAALKVVWGSKPEADHIATKINPYWYEVGVTVPEVEPVRPTLPLMIGDCIHNLRSALDHLAWQLSVNNNAPLSAAEKTFFPICLTKSGKAGFDKLVKTRIMPFVSPAALAAIEESQPYAAYDIPEEADIWVLHKLDIVDKHRLLLIAGQHCAVTEFTFTFPNHVPFHQVIPNSQWKPMEHGAEIIRFQIPAEHCGPGKVHMQVDGVRAVQFINTGLPCDGMPVEEVLHQLFSLVSGTVGDFESRFFNE